VYIPQCSKDALELELPFRVICASTKIYFLPSSQPASNNKLDILNETQTHRHALLNREIIPLMILEETLSICLSLRLNLRSIVRHSTT